MDVSIWENVAFYLFVLTPTPVQVSKNLFPNMSARKTRRQNAVALGTFHTQLLSLYAEEPECVSLVCATHTHAPRTRTSLVSSICSHSSNSTASPCTSVHTSDHSSFIQASDWPAVGIISPPGACLHVD